MAPRKLSGRDPKKALGQILALGPGPIVERPQSHNLIVCGAKHGERDGWLFADFMGISATLTEFHIRGDFYSCFPLEKHFKYLQKRKPPLDTIKFGKFGPDGSYALHTYSKERFDRGHLWWTQVPPSQLLDRLMDWIWKIQARSRAGDVVNIILDGHGHQQNGFMAGDHSLHPEVFANLMSHFKLNVQVNFFPDFCYSGQFLEALAELNLAHFYCVASADANSKSWSHTRSMSGRARNGRFTTALVLSMANIRSNPTSSTPWSIRDHENFMITQLKRNITPGEEITLPIFWSSDDLDPSLPLERLFFRDMVSFSSGHSAAGRNPRAEWPTTNPKIRRSLGETSHLPKNAVSGAVTKALMDEMAQCDTKIGYPPDIGINDQMYMREPDWRGMLRNLYWRFQRQYVVWEIYLMLADRGFVEARALTLPMNLFSPNNDTCRIISLLSLFSKITNDDRLAYGGEIALQNIGWDLDLTWLATVIVRTGCEYRELFLTIQESGYLGKMNWKAIEMMKELDGTPKPDNPEHGDEKTDADGCEGKTETTDTTAAAPTTHPFGMWLPDGLPIQDADCLTKSGSGPCLARFHEIESIFFETEKLQPELLESAHCDGKEMGDEINFNDARSESDDEMIPMWLLEEGLE